MFLASRCVYYRAAYALIAILAIGNATAGWQAPLSEQDIILLGSQAIAQYQTGTRSSSDPKTGDMLGIEVLMVELQEKKLRTINDARLAEVFIFDYSTNNASVQLINVDTHELVSTHPIDNIHLPLNQREKERVTQLLLSDVPLLEKLGNEYIEQFGQALTTLVQLDMKVSIWEPSMSDTDTKNCKFTRCALVSVFTHEHYNFSVEPVVELQNAIVYLGLVQ